MEPEPHLLCDTCLRPADPVAACTRHPHARGLDPTNPEDASWIASLREMQTHRRRQRLHSVYWLSSYILLAIVMLSSGSRTVLMTLLVEVPFILVIVGPMVWLCIDAVRTRLVPESEGV